MKSQLHQGKLNDKISLITSLTVSICLVLYFTITTFDVFKPNSGLHITCIHINALIPVPHIVRFRHLPQGCLNLHQHLP